MEMEVVLTDVGCFEMQNAASYVVHEDHRSSRAREFHPHPLTEPCVKVSPHTALHTLCFVHMLLSSYPPLCLRVV